MSDQPSARRVSRSKGKKTGPKAKVKARAGVELPPPGEPLRRVEHETFCQMRLKGLNQGQAYMAVYGGDLKKGEAHAGRLTQRAEVAARLAWLMEQAAAVAQEKAVIDKLWVVEWCREVIETPVTEVEWAVQRQQVLLRSEGKEISADDPDPLNRPLSESQERALRLGCEMTPSEHGTKVKMVGKMDAMKLIVDVLGLKKSDDDNEVNGKGMMDGLKELMLAVRARVG
jgi:hypothetical protein